MITPEQRREFLKSLPFVTWVDKAQRCDGVVRAPIKAYWHPKTHRRQPESARDPYRCKNPAHWRFRALKRSFAQSGVYCMSHLFARGLWGDPAEEDRYRKYSKQWKQAQTK